MTPKSTSTTTRFPAKTLFRSIDNAMGAAIGKVPLNPATDLTTVDKLGNLVARTVNDLTLSTVTGIATQDETGRMVIPGKFDRSEEHTSALQSLMRISYAVFCLKKKTTATLLRLLCLYIP